MKNSKGLKIMYFLRGLGVGIVFTGALFMLFSKVTSTEVSMTKEEVIAKAKEYGMVEGIDFKLEELLDGTNAPNASSSPNESPSPTEDASLEATSGTSESPSESPKTIHYIKVTIAEGDSPRTVANKLQNAGLIQDADKFYEYLKENGYADKIIAGTYRIQDNALYSTIAKILRGK